MATIDPIGKAHRPECKYIPRTYRDLLRRDPPKETIEDVLPATGSVCVYGQSGAGKTFLALDMALAIARGDPYWFGYRVAQRHVVYICLEGEAHIRDRLKAHSDGAGKEIPDAFTIVDNAPFALGDEDDVGHLLTLIAGHTHPVIIIDTLTRATAGMDLNGGADMGRAIASIDRIRRDGDCLVVSIYHSTIKSNGPNATEMGHSSLRGSLDASLFVWADGDTKQWTTAKAKDAADGKSHQFGLASKAVRVNQWGNARSSCFVTETHRPRFDPEAEKRARADQLENFIVSGFNEPTRRYYTKRNLQDNRPPGISRDSISPLLAMLEAEGRVVEVPLPESERNGKRQTYLHPIKRIPIAREKR